MEDRLADNMDEVSDEEGFLERMHDSEMIQMMEREQREARNLAAGKKGNIFTTFGSKFFGKFPNPIDESLFNPAACLRVTITKFWIPVTQKPRILEYENGHRMFSQRMEIMRPARVVPVRLLDEKMDQESDDEGFLERMQNSEMILMMEREQRGVMYSMVGKKINVFTKLGSEFFPNADFIFDEAIFNPAFCLRVSMNSRWIIARRRQISEEQEEEKDDDEEEENESDDEPMMDAGDVDINFNNLDMQIDNNEDSEEEKKKTLKRKNEDDNEGCKYAKRRHDEE